MRWRVDSLRSVLLAGLALSGACAAGRADDDLELAPPPGFVAPPVRPLRDGPIYGRVGLGRGFWPMELADGKTWRWMADRGEVRLPNRHVGQKLHVFGWLPLEFLAGPPTIQITLQNRVLDRFVAADHQLNREYVVKPEQLGDGPYVLLLIETSATARVPGDTRDLGIAIEGIKWEDMR